MIKKIIFILLIGLFIAGCGLIVMREPGFAVFSYGDYTIEIELIKFYFGVVVLFIVFYFIFRLLGALYRLPSRLHAQRQSKHQMEILQGMEAGVFNANRYNWEGALRNVTTHLKSSPIKKGQHFLAAKYAQRLGDKKQSNTHISSLRELNDGRQLANSLEAEFALENDKTSKIESLIRADTSESLNDLNTLAKTYIRTGDVEGLAKILPKLQPHSRKSGHTQKTVTEGLACLVQHYDVNSNSERLAELWKPYAKVFSGNPTLLQNYVSALVNQKEDILAEQIITTRLKDHWDEQLIQDYGRLSMGNIGQRIKQAEAWLPQHKESAGLLLTLGRLYKREKLWGKAKNYLESSLSRKPLATTYAQLAELHEFLDEHSDAQRCVKKGLFLATRN